MILSVIPSHREKSLLVQHHYCIDVNLKPYMGSDRNQCLSVKPIPEAEYDDIRTTEGPEMSKLGMNVKVNND